jgi:rhamnose transport system permease protein
MRRLPTWEATLILLLLLAGLAASLTSPFYLTTDQISYSLQQSITVVGLIALGLMAVVVIGEIDISLPAIMALGNIMFAQLSQGHVPVWLAFLIVAAACALCGLINGLLVVILGLPSLAITLGAMGAYRALALLLGGQKGFADFQPGCWFWSRSCLGSSCTAPCSVARFLPAD